MCRLLALRDWVDIGERKVGKFFNWSFQNGKLSIQRIYQFILEDKQKGGELYKHLRHQHKKYRKRYGSPKRQGSIRNRRFIDDRPAIVNNKEKVLSNAR